MRANSARDPRRSSRACELTVSGFGVVVNPHATGNLRSPDRFGKLRRTVGDTGLVRQTKSLEDLQSVAREFRRQQIDVLAVCGGDGSCFRTLSAVVEAYGDTPLPIFLPLYAGSMNTIARSAGCRWERPEPVLSAAVERYRAGHPFQSTERHLIVVNGRHYGFMVGAAFGYCQVEPTRADATTTSSARDP